MVTRGDGAYVVGVADQLHRKMVEADVVADLLERPRVHKGRDAVDPHLQVLGCQRCGDGDHVLLGHAGVDESFAHGLFEWFKSIEAEIAGEKDHVLSTRSGDQRVAELLPHGLEISSIACW